MSLNSHERGLIANIDRKVKRAESNHEIALFQDLITLAPIVKNILYSHEEKEIDLYMHAYEGFRYFLDFLQNNSVNYI